MSKQIAVRLPDEVAYFVDEVIAEGGAASRAALVIRLLERERRRKIAERDILLLKAAATEPDEFAGLAEFAADTPLDDID